MWEKEKLLITSNFSFSHSVFKRLVLQTRKNQGLFGKGLTDIQNVLYKDGLLIYCMVFNTFFNIIYISYIMAASSHMHLFLELCLAQYSFLATCCFLNWQLSKQWTVKKEEQNPVARTIMIPQKEYWSNWKSQYFLQEI